MRRFLRPGLAGLLLFLGAGPVTAATPPLHAMTFTTAAEPYCIAGQCGKAVEAEGIILGLNTIEAFQAYLEAQGSAPPQTVLFNSRGGMFRASIALGELIRLRGLNTAVRDDHRCWSACVYALMGGVKRQVEPDAALGVHVNRPFYGPTDTVQASDATDMLYDVGGQIQYLQKMDVRLEFLNVIYSSYTNTVHPFDAACARYMGVANVGQSPASDPCNAHIQVRLGFGYVTPADSRALLTPLKTATGP
jgi:hypothetical protein